MRKLALAITVALITLVTQSVRAQGGGDEPVTGIYVEHLSGGQWLAVSGFPNRNANPPESGLLSGSNVSVINPAPSGPYRIFAVDPATTDIGTITFWGTRDLMVGTGFNVVNPAAPLPVAGARHVAAIFNDTGNLRLQVRAIGNVGQVSAYQIVRLDAGTFTSSIAHNPAAVSPGPVLGWLEANSILGSVTSYGGDISRVRVAITNGNGSLSGSLSALNGTITTVEVNGNLTGSMLADLGSIGTVLVTNGNIGTPSTLSTIRAKNGIARVTAQNIYANVTSNYNNTVGPNNLTGWLHRLETTATTGAFAGAINTNQLGSAGNPADYVRVRGTFDGDFKATGNVVGPITLDGGLPSNRKVTVGVSLVQGYGSIVLPPNGLAGQIIINQGNWTGAVWGGLVQVGSINVGPAPYYTTSAASLGGGAIGLAPFHMHDADCVPPNGTEPAGIVNNTIKLRFYGQVGWSAGMPVSVRWIAWSGGALPGRNDPGWQNISGDFAATGNHSREMQVYPTTMLDFSSGAAYSIVPASSTSIVSEGKQRRAPGGCLRGTAGV